MSLLRYMPELNLEPLVAFSVIVLLHELDPDVSHNPQGTEMKRRLSTPIRSSMKGRCVLHIPPGCSQSPFLKRKGQHPGGIDNGYGWTLPYLVVLSCVLEICP